MPSDRPSLYAQVDEDTLDRWHAFATAVGTPVSAVVEAIGRQLNYEDGPDWQQEVAAQARLIAAERRSRRLPD